MSKPGSGANTPSRASRVVYNLADELIKNPPNNLNLVDPTEQFRANDLIGVQGTEAISDGPTEDEMKRVQAMADRLNKQ